MPVTKKRKPVKKTGFAPEYTPIKDTLDLPLARVRFNGQKIIVIKKDEKGVLTSKKLNAVYQTPHGVAVVYGRLKHDAGAYLLALMRKIERDQERAFYRSQQASLAVQVAEKKK